VNAGGTGFRLPKRPLYGVLHEAIYCSGPGAESAWAAQSLGRAHISPHFRWLCEGWDVLTESPEKIKPLYFSGEKIYEFMLEDAGPAMEPFIVPAQQLAHRKNWPVMFDREQLRRNKVPMRALIYSEDLFIDFDSSMETVAMIANCTGVIARLTGRTGPLRRGR
jgi:hypothetical protein